ncbi:MAG: M23 family metallopeptidase [Acidobacteriota bacterium]
MRWAGRLAVAVAVLVSGTGLCRAQGLTVSHQARAVAPGEILLVTISGPDPIEAVDAIAFGRPAAAFPGDTPAIWHLLAGIDLDTAPGPQDVSIGVRIHGERVQLVHRIVVVPKRFGARRLTVDARFVTPPAAVVGRIDREQKRLVELLAVVSAQRLWRGPFVAPVDGLPAFNFGQRSVFNGQPRGSHRGADFASPAGAPVSAPGAGRIVLSEDLYYTGNTVLIDHGLGLFSLLAHLSHTDVRTGDLVDRGTRVGAVGATGRATGPHLHWTLRWGSAAVDPLSLLALKGMPE